VVRQRPDSQFFQEALKASTSLLRCIVVAATTGFCLLSGGIILNGLMMTGPAEAQNFNTLVAAQNNPNEDMIIEADELIYNNNDRTVTARGNVDIFYNDYIVQAEQVTFNRVTSRVQASGNVKITEPGGNIVYAESADLTDDLSDGFVKALRIETPDQTRFAAQSARRDANGPTVLEKGVYTACKICEDNPQKPPTWQVKASRIIYDREEKMVYYSNARLEFFGIPIAYIPAFAHADPTVKRKSGLLAPGYLYNSRFGTRIDTPYYIALDPSYDVTLTPYYTSRQGFLGRAEWRQRLINGAYSIRASGIKQMERSEFAGESGDKDWRYALESKGLFNLNSRWTTGWDGTLMSDRNYLKDYKFQKAGDMEIISQAWLTGLQDTNYFDTRFQHFRVTRSPVLVSGSNILDAQRFQPVVHPVTDYDYTLNRPVLGGQLGFTTNLVSLSREDDHVVTQYNSQNNGLQPLGRPLYYGFEGQYNRAQSMQHGNGA
jgi:LPS-assembly protein